MTIEFLRGDGITVTMQRTLAPLSRTTVRLDDVPGLESTAVSTRVTSTNDVAIAVERTMRWDASAYGAHTEKATAGAAAEWYFAEGAQGFFSTYLLLVNPHATANVAHVTWLREGEPALTRDYPLAPSSRVTIDASTEPDLVNRSFGARVVFDQPGAAERAMYFGASPLWSGGHASAGATAPATRWLLAEGATGSYFTTFVLVANPNDAPADLTFTYLPLIGLAVTTTKRLEARQRMTVNIAEEDPSLASAAVSTDVVSTVPVVVERAQYWPQPAWHEAHNSFGVTSAATTWGLAEGRIGGSRGESDLHPARESEHGARGGRDDHVPARERRRARREDVHGAGVEPLQRRDRRRGERRAGADRRIVRRAHRCDAADRRRAIGLRQREWRDVGRRHECHCNTTALRLGPRRK